MPGKTRFTEEEISKGPNEPVDIAFRLASFQISEILDQDRRRGVEFQASVQKFGQASCADDVLEPWKNSLPILFEDVAVRVVHRLGEKSLILSYRA